jgi:hypothetical protein
VDSDTCNLVRPLEHYLGTLCIIVDCPRLRLLQLLPPFLWHLHQGRTHTRLEWLAQRQPYDRSLELRRPENERNSFAVRWRTSKSDLTTNVSAAQLKTRQSHRSSSYHSRFATTSTALFSRSSIGVLVLLKRAVSNESQVNLPLSMSAVGFIWRPRFFRLDLAHSTSVWATVATIGQQYARR